MYIVTSMYSFSDDQATLQMIDYINQKCKIKHYVMLYVTFALLSFLSVIVYYVPFYLYTFSLLFIALLLCPYLYWCICYNFLCDMSVSCPVIYFNLLPIQEIYDITIGRKSAELFVSTGPYPADCHKLNNPPFLCKLYIIF